uniref:RELT TNF receptor n=1 Tax=Amphilophus citrinellus TaxID=61819 RepID=A0A3Q0R422_AMPCI
MRPSVKCLRPRLENGGVLPLDSGREAAQSGLVQACEQIQSPAEEVHCQLCPAGTFSDALDAELCRPHTSCELLGRKAAASGNATSDALFLVLFLSFLSGDLHNRVARNVGKGQSGGAGGPANSTVVRSAEEKTAEYAVFALVPVFCVMGLLGILICNILKKKGYRCTGEKEGGDEEAATAQKEGNSCPYISDDLNEDTISVLVRLITEKKGKYQVLLNWIFQHLKTLFSPPRFPMLSPLSPFRSLPRLCPHQSHLHTISGLSGLAPKHGYRCTRCAQKKWPPVLIPPLDSLKDPLNEVKEKKEGELTVLSVGRFQVAQIPEQKPCTVETKRASQEQRNSFFGGKSFSLSSSSGIRR